MPQRTLRVDRPLPEVWAQLQKLETWEGVGGMDELRSPRYDPDGSLTRFEYSLDTPIGTVRDTADVSSDAGDRRCAMHVRTDTKGLRVTIDVELVAAGDTTEANITLDASAANFLTKPLAATLRHTLESGIDRETERMRSRLEAAN